MIIVTMHKAEVSCRTFYLFVLCQYKVDTLYSLSGKRLQYVCVARRPVRAAAGTATVEPGWLSGDPDPEAMYDH